MLRSSTLVNLGTLQRVLLKALGTLFIKGPGLFLLNIACICIKTEQCNKIKKNCKSIVNKT